MDSNRVGCLFRTKKTLHAVNTLLEELGNDISKNRLLKCKKCESGFDEDTCGSYHDYLKTVYDTLFNLKSALKYME